jgi:hypothetical protein
MKLFSIVARLSGIATGAIMALSWSFPVQAQTFDSNFVVSVTLPTNGSVFPAPTNIQISALVSNAPGNFTEVVFDAAPGGPGPLPRFALYLGTATNGVPVGPPNSQSELFTFTWTNARAGTWALAAQAMSSNGTLTAQALAQPVTITVQAAQVLSVSLVSPCNGAVFAAPANIELIAKADESGGSVADVQFLDGANSLGIVSNWVVVDPLGPPIVPPIGRAYILLKSGAKTGGRI